MTKHLPVACSVDDGALARRQSDLRASVLADSESMERCDVGVNAGLDANSVRTEFAGLARTSLHLATSPLSRRLRAFAAQITSRPAVACLGRPAVAGNIRA
jgi:hypothetical protein